MLKSYEFVFDLPNKNQYFDLEDKLLSYNREKSTNYEIVHNGLELWIHMTEHSKEDNDNVVKIISECNFKTPNYYGYKWFGHLLWPIKK